MDSMRLASLRRCHAHPRLGWQVVLTGLHSVTLDLRVCIASSFLARMKDAACLLVVACALACIGRSVATVGVDVSSSVSESEWKCLQSPGGQGAVEFAVVRVFQSSGRVDPNGAKTIIAAKNAGIKHVDGYIFPCVPCGDAKTQVDKTVDALRDAGAPYGMLWYDIEPLSWSNNKNENTKFLKEMIDAGKARGVRFGIYSNWNSWSEIMGGWTYPASLGLPLWYPHYDDSKSFSDFRAFGGWSKPNIKQYLGTHTSCGVGVDYNWYPGAVDTYLNATK